jgi:hypothetical protein
LNKPDRRSGGADIAMEPVAATREAIGELDPLGDDVLLDRLLDQAARVRELVPDCIGLSITLVGQDLTFTLVATEHVIATLDAVQYLDGGPCANVCDDQVARQYTIDGLAEHQWQLFAAASAAAGVASTLTLPMLDERGRVTGSLNFYGADPHCFDDHHSGLAEIFAAWAPGAVTNADLSFRTRATAADAPEKIRGRNRLDTAIGLIAARASISTEEASRALADAASRAGVDPGDLAEAVLIAHRRRQS